MVSFLFLFSRYFFFYLQLFLKHHTGEIHCVMLLFWKCSTLPFFSGNPRLRGTSPCKKSLSTFDCICHNFQRLPQMTFYYSPGLFQEKSQLQSTQTAQFSRCMERNAEVHTSGKRAVCTQSSAYQLIEGTILFWGFFCWGVAFLGEKLNSLFLTP